MPLTPGYVELVEKYRAIIRWEEDRTMLVEWKGEEAVEDALGLR